MLQDLLTVAQHPNFWSSTSIKVIGKSFHLLFSSNAAGSFWTVAFSFASSFSSYPVLLAHRNTPLQNAIFHRPGHPPSPLSRCLLCLYQNPRWFGLRFHLQDPDTSDFDLRQEFLLARRSGDVRRRTRFPQCHPQRRPESVSEELCLGTTREGRVLSCY